MNNLEFINKKIKETEKSIKHWEMLLKNYPNEEVLTRCLNTRKEELQAFQEVKTTLKAWYSIESGLIYEEESKHRMSEEMRTAYTIYLTDDEIENIQKALEENNNE